MSGPPHTGGPAPPRGPGSASCGNSMPLSLVSALPSCGQHLGPWCSSFSHTLAGSPGGPGVVPGRPRSLWGHAGPLTPRGLISLSPHLNSLTACSYRAGKIPGGRCRV